MKKKRQGCPDRPSRRLGKNQRSSKFSTVDETLNKRSRAMLEAKDEKSVSLGTLKNPNPNRSNKVSSTPGSGKREKPNPVESLTCFLTKFNGSNKESQDLTLSILENLGQTTSFLTGWQTAIERLSQALTPIDIDSEGREKRVSRGAF